MRVAVLPGKLPSGMQLFPPLVAQTLGAAPGGLSFGLRQVGVVPFTHLAALAACTVSSHGADVPVLLLFLGGRRRPVAVEVPKVRSAEFGLSGPPHRPENLRQLIRIFLRQAPHMAVDSATLEFLEGRMLRARGEKLSDLADAVGLILVEGKDLKEVAVPAGRGSTEAGQEAARPAPPESPYHRR